MGTEWLDGLRPTGETFGGGQGTAFAAIKAEGRKVFVKKLRRPGDRRARARFAREAVAYETLVHPGIPVVVSHNADEWRTARTELYLATEFVEGEDVGAAVRRGVFSLDAALAVTLDLLRIVEFCHANDVVHRDIKPANVMLSPRGPVIVDFGLSFNADDAEGSDLTRVNEEVGNRFLRLPEHSTGGRSPVSDLTQIAGILLFLLTGVEPRVLVDENGLRPHQRAPAREALAGADAGRARKLLSVLDRCFDPRQSVRPQTAGQLIDLLEAVLPDDDAGPDIDDLLARLDAAAHAPP